MRFHILTLFPEMVEEVLHTSILKRAEDRGLISVEAVNIRDFTEERHGKVDDYPYGGGAGMIMQAQPIYSCWEHVLEGIQSRRTQENAVRTVYMSPQGRTFTQKMAHSFAENEDLVILCGHYEGVDERVLDRMQAESVSVGDYVLTGGELPAMILVDAVSRLIPGVLHNEDSASTESFEQGLLEYPQYSRPEVWMGEHVPEILLSGDHAKVDDWRLGRSLLRTRERRPDLLEDVRKLPVGAKDLKRILKLPGFSEKEREFFRNLLQRVMDFDNINKL